MKYIKYFESTIKDDLSNLKKYILWNGSDGNLYIFETGEKYVTTWGPPLNCCRILYKYMYNKKEKRLYDESGTKGDFSIGADRKHLIIYQSDNIQDCIDVINTIENTIKYNI